MLKENNTIKKEDYTILIVDDEQEVVEQNLLLLEVEGYEVMTANNGKDAIEVVKNGGVDIILLDYFMPGFTGEEVVKEIRNFNNEVIIILQTGYSGEKPPLEMLERLDIQGYHDKTEGSDKLLLWVAASVRSCSQLRENKRMFEEIQLANKTIETIKKDHDKLMEQQKLAFVGELTWSITEKLNIPIWGIRGLYDNLDSLAKEYNESIDSPEVTKEDHREIAKEITDCVEKSKAHINDLEEIVHVLKTQLMRIEEAQDITVEELVNKSHTIFQKELKIHHCSLKQDIQNPLAVIKNGDILVIVLNNLILNSVQAYGENGGEIQVKAENIDNNIRISVVDYAEGISKDVQEKIFKEVVTNKKSNLGLGLYICNAIVKGFLGGRMWFESEEGEGTTFFISIPIV